MRPGHFIPHFLYLAMVGFERGSLLREVFAGVLQMPVYALALPEKELQFVFDDVFQVYNGNLVTALTADIFRASGSNVHLGTAGAVGEAAKEVGRRFARPFP